MTATMTTPQPLTVDAALRRELTAGERILWSAQPRATHMKRGFGIWLFAIPWTVFSLGWEAASILPWFASSKTPEAIQWTFGIVFPLFGLPFVAIGFWMLWQPIRAMRLAGQTIYALTERRLIRVVTGPKSEFASVMLSQIGPMQRREARDGVGDLAIQTHSRVDSDGDRVTEKFLVTGVPDVARLERLIVENTPA